MATIISRKTILALAIATASAAHAAPAQINVSGSTGIEVATGSFDSITLNGSANRDAGQDGIDLDGPQVSGNFVNDANYNLTGDFVDAIGIEDDSADGAIGGSFINNGTINASGYNASGINISLMPLSARTA